MADEMDLRQDDRLPWLETVEPDEERTAPVGKVIALVVVGLAILAAIVFGIYKLQTRHGGGNGELIEAQEGDYKVRPDDPGGLKVKGEGDAAVATSAGKAGNAAIDLNAVPEKPVDGRRVSPTVGKAKGDGGRNTVAQVPASGGKLVATPPVTAQRPTGPGSASGGSLVQLGAYPSEASANAAWAGFSKRFSYLAPLGKAVQPVATGGRTLYRLRVNAGSANQAADICGRLRVAGESCFIAN